MDIFEYVAVLTSIIIGLGIAHLLRGVARLIQHPDTEPVYWGARLLGRISIPDPGVLVVVGVPPR